MINVWKKFDGGWCGRSAGEIVLSNVDDVVPYLKDELK